MKKITVPAVDTAPNAFFVDPNNKYYGLKSPFRAFTGFITRERFESGNYVTKCIDRVTIGNDWNGLAYRTESLAELINALRGDGFEVIEFDTYRELFKWLSES